MDLRKLKTLIDLVSESSITELEITEAEGKVRIVKAMPGTATHAPGMVTVPHYGSDGVNPMPGNVAATGTTGSSPSPSSTPAAGAAPGVPDAPAQRMIKSPMVGTFYRAASPGAKAFADVGMDVKAGQAVCIVEAMKIMNEIESDLDGRIVKVMCENGQAVEFGQPLFIVE
ncbi:MAG: acetyl-CoA carboxylase biotin carboxyl carrier protein [Rubrivivax sp.]|jgi:acetyl-CoA carboxylase biotin carboxyl carrier protein|nr:acetyl-CoA carboxylase biotin carboxyl carrier protein [Rubrivivax sp.]